MASEKLVQLNQRLILEQTGQIVSTTKRLEEYVSFVDRSGKLDPGYLDVRLITLSSREEGYRLANKAISMLSPEDLKKAKKVAQTHKSPYILDFIDKLNAHQKVTA